MEFYLAPMEGVTGHAYRRAFAKCFGGIDTYMTPFLTPNQNAYLNRREAPEVLPENNNYVGGRIRLVPQVMSKRSDYLEGIIEELKSYGYTEVNLNIGCPSGTVVAKGKGAGMLIPEDLERFLDEFYSHSPKVKLSLKTRVGLTDTEDWPLLVKVFNKYPLSEVVVHPRVREDYYKLPVRMETFDYAVEHLRHPIVYNGDVCTVEDIQKIEEKYPDIKGIMIGRGLLKNPYLLDEYGEKAHNIQKEYDRGDVLGEFLEEILMGYYAYMKNEYNPLSRMKELWFYLHHLIPDSDKLWKKINKCKTFEEYRKYVGLAMEQLRQ